MEKHREEFVAVLKEFINEDVEYKWEEKLVELGLDSMASIELLLAIEEKFGVEFPDELLTEDTFASSSKLWSVLESLLSNEVSR